MQKHRLGTGQSNGAPPNEGWVWDLILQELRGLGKNLPELVALLAQRAQQGPGGITLPGVARGLGLQSQVATIFEAQAIRGTAATPGKAMLRVPGRAWGYGFLVLNQHNQSGSFQLMGNMSDNYGTAGIMGGAVSIAANTPEFLGVDSRLWAPYLGLRVTYATAPTSGELTVSGRAEPPVG